MAKVGLPYASEAKEIPGWYVVETPDNASRTLLVNEAQEAVYYTNAVKLPSDCEIPR